MFCIKTTTDDIRLPSERGQVPRYRYQFGSCAAYCLHPVGPYPCDALEAWFQEHIHNSFPSLRERAALAQRCQITEWRVLRYLCSRRAKQPRYGLHSKDTADDVAAAAAVLTGLGRGRTGVDEQNPLSGAAAAAVVKLLARSDTGDPGRVPRPHT